MHQPQTQVGRFELCNESPPLRHTSHVPTWLNSHLRADWTGARGHFASVFQKRLRSALRICVYTGLVLSLFLLLPHTLQILRLHNGCPRARSVAFHRHDGAYLQIDPGEF
jgi:hypothetical protein